MVWDVSIWNNIQHGRRAAVRFGSISYDIAADFIEDAGVKAFEVALSGIPEYEFFRYGGLEYVAEGMYKLYRERTADDD